MISEQQIALSFFPLSDSHFQFTVYRRPYNEGDTKTDFPKCSRRKLPVSEFSDAYSEYWVNLRNEQAKGFEPFECDSFMNFRLTVDLLYQLLREKCETDFTGNRISDSDSFRKHTIFFILRVHPEGRECVWLEPYYLKAAKRFGFLADFKFFINEGVPFTKRIQQLSLSLDEKGRSNTNFYFDKYEKLLEFTRRFHGKLFPLCFSDREVRVDRDLILLSSDSLRFKTYVFSNDETGKSQFLGVKTRGPLTRISSGVRVFFVYRSSDRQFSLDLYRALRGESFTNTFPGMEAMFGYKLSNDTVSGGTINDFTPPELERIIQRILNESSEIPIVPVLITPFSKDDYSDEASAQYYAAKYAFLRHHLPSQFVSLRRLQNKEQLKWAISNIGLQLFAKMGGQPWKVYPETKKCLIVGLGQSHKESEGNIERYFAYSVLTDSSGLYKDLKILGQSSDLRLYLAGFKQKLMQIFNDCAKDYDTFVVHTSFTIRQDELQAVNEVLADISKASASAKDFTVMRFNEHNKFFGYSRGSNSMIPYESSFVRIADKEFLVWFEGLQVQNPTVRKRIERPLHVEFLYSSNSLDPPKMRAYLQDAVNLSGANWRGFNAKSLPVSVYYAQLVARYYKEFQSLGYEDIDLEKITPWFL